MGPDSRQYQVIRGGYVLDIPRRSAGLADILVHGDSIAAVGAPGMPAPADAQVVDASQRLIMPGLVNAHTHGHGSLGKGLGDKWSLELLLNAGPWISGSYTLEDKRTAARLNAAEMVLKGCTAAYDMYFEAPTPSLEGIRVIGEAYAEVGVRVVLAPMMADTTLYRAIPGLMDALPEPQREQARAISAAGHGAHLAVCAKLLENWPFARDRVLPALGPTIPLHCTDEFIRGCRDLANDYDCGIHMHLAESRVQAVSGLKRYGKTLAAHIDGLGLLGPRFTGAHCVWLTDDDLKRMQDRGASVAHNPGSNLRLGSGVAPVRKMLDLGIGVGVGTDGATSGDSQNMFDAVRMAAFVSRIAVPEPEDWLGSWEVLEMATAGGAGVLGLGGQVGRLESGYRADLLFLDLGNVNYVPLNDAANQIVNCEDSSAVHSVMIGGRMVLSDRRFTTFDFDALRQCVAGTVSRLREHNAPALERMQAMAAFVSRHCVGLCHEHYPVRRRLDA